MLTLRINLNEHTIVKVAAYLEKYLRIIKNLFPSKQQKHGQLNMSGYRIYGIISVTKISEKTRFITKK
jgi:hypothetical protein